MSQITFTTELTHDGDHFCSANYYGRNRSLDKFPVWICGEYIKKLFCIYNAEKILLTAYMYKPPGHKTIRGPVHIRLFGKKLSSGDYEIKIGDSEKLVRISSSTGNTLKKIFGNSAWVEIEKIG